MALTLAHPGAHDWLCLGVRPVQGSRAHLWSGSQACVHVYNKAATQVLRERSPLGPLAWFRQKRTTPWGLGAWCVQPSLAATLLPSTDVFRATPSSSALVHAAAQACAGIHRLDASWDSTRVGSCVFIAFYALKKNAKIRELKISGFKCGFKCGPPSADLSFVPAHFLSVILLSVSKLRETRKL